MRRRAERSGPLDAIVANLEALEAEARNRARRGETLAGFAYAMAEAAAYRNAAAQIAALLDAISAGEA